MTTVCLTWSRVSFPQLVRGQVVEPVLQQAPVSVQEQEQEPVSVQEPERERQRVQEQVWVQHLQRRRRQ